MDRWSLSDARQRCQETDIVPLLQQGRLVGYATVIGKAEGPVAIPQSAWTEIDIMDEEGTNLIHRPSSTLLADLRIFPVLHAPDAPELLHDRTLAEVFMATIVKDPEVAALGRHVMKAEDFHHVFDKGYSPNPFVGPYWRMDLTATSLAESFISSESFPKERSAQTAASIIAAAVALVNRICALRDLLSSGHLLACGTNRMTGELKTVHRAQWQRKDYAIDSLNGDLREFDKGKWIPVWTALLLEANPSSQGATVEKSFLDLITNTKNPRRSVIAAETQCQRWLEKTMCEHPEGKTKDRNKKVLRREALARWEGLSGDGFDRAWGLAISNTGKAGEAWSKAGRPRES